MYNFKLSGNTFEPRATKLYESTNVINVNTAGRIASLAGGAFLYISSLGEQNIFKKVIRYGGIYLLYRGISGNCPVTALIEKDDFKPHSPAVNIRTFFIVRAPRKLAYSSWRNLEKLPKFLKHIQRIKVIDEIHSRWTLKTPGSAMPSIEWKAEIIEQEDGRELSWRSLPGSSIETAGKINFADTTGGTEVSVLITYRPPAGYIGSAVASFINSSLRKMVEADLANFKKYIEAKAIEYSYDTD